MRQLRLLLAIKNIFIGSVSDKETFCRWPLTNCIIFRLVKLLFRFSFDTRHWKSLNLKSCMMVSFDKILLIERNGREQLKIVEKEKTLPTNMLYWNENCQKVCLIRTCFSRYYFRISTSNALRRPSKWTQVAGTNWKVLKDQQLSEFEVGR